MITFIATILADAALTLAVRETYTGLNLPLWEAGFTAFFLGLPIDMVVNAGIHAGMMKIPASTGVEVWFVQRVMLLGVILAVAGFAAGAGVC